MTRTEQRILDTIRADLPFLCKSAEPDDRIFAPGWALEDTLEPDPLDVASVLRPVTLRRVMDAVCKITGETPAAVLGTRRKQPLATHRQLAAYVMYEHCPQASLLLIGAFLHRDHTTIIHSTRNIKARLIDEPDLVETYRLVCLELGVEP